MALPEDEISHQTQEPEIQGWHSVFLPADCNFGGQIRIFSYCREHESKRYSC